MRFAAVVMCAGCAALAPAPVSAQQGIDGNAVREAVRKLCAERLDDCVLHLDVAVVTRSTQEGVSYEAGKLVFARHAGEALGDAAVVGSPKPIAKPDLASVSDCVQFYMAPGRRGIGVHYRLDKGQKSRTSVSVDPRRSYEAYFEALTTHVRLNYLLAAFGPTGKSLSELVKQDAVGFRPSGAGRVTAAYRTEYGVVEVELAGQADRVVVAGARVVQARTDVYTHLSNGATLAEITQSVLGTTPGGLARVAYEFELKHDDRRPDVPFTTLVVTEAYAAADRTWNSTQTLTLADYRKCAASECVSALRVPVPDGASVSSLDPNFRPLALVYHEGEVVRKVDGATLDEVVAGRPVSRRTTYLAAAAGLAALTAAGLYLYRRLARRPQA